jgi:hypothetical protein
MTIPRTSGASSHCLRARHRRRLGRLLPSVPVAPVVQLRPRPVEAAAPAPAPPAPPPVDPWTMHDPLSLAWPVPRPAPGGPVDVRLPLVVPAVSAGAFAVWVDLIARVGPRRSSLPVPVSLLATRLRRDPDVIRGWLRELTGAGLLRHRKDPNVRAPRLPAGYAFDGRLVTMPSAALAALEDGAMGPQHLVSLFRWYDACLQATPEPGWSGDGWTKASVRDIAESNGQSVGSARRHRSLLVRLGFLDTLERPGYASVTALPGRLRRRSSC